MSWDELVPTLKMCVRTIASGLNQQSVNVAAAEELVSVVVEILGFGLYPGTSVWTLLKLLERIGQRAESHPSPLHTRLKFAPKIAVGIIQSMPSAPEFVKARAFVRCALNMGCLRAVLELMSTVTTSNRECCLGEADTYSEHYLIRDMWRYLVTGVDSGAADDPTTYLLPTLLRPYILSHATIYNPDSDSEVRFHQVIAALAPVAGPELDVFLLGLPRAEAHFSFYLPLFNTDDAFKYQPSNRDAGGPAALKSLAVKRALQEMASPTSPKVTPEDAPILTTHGDEEQRSDDGAGGETDQGKKKTKTVKKTKIIKKIVKKKKVKEGNDNEAEEGDDGIEPVSPALPASDSVTSPLSPLITPAAPVQNVSEVLLAPPPRVIPRHGVTVADLRELNEQCRQLLAEASEILGTQIKPTPIQPLPTHLPSKIATIAVTRCTQGVNSATTAARRRVIARFERLESELMAEYDTDL